MKVMQLIFFLLYLLVSFLASAAEDNIFKIASGPKTGEYINIAKAICPALGKLFECEAIETQGTLDNKKRLESGEVNIALAKSNVAEEWMKEPAFASKYTIIKRIGDESLFVFGKPEVLKAAGSWIGVRNNAFLLSIGLPGELSGDAAVFNALKSVQGSPLANIAVKVYADRPALVAAVKSGEVKLGFITQVPNPENPLFASINESGLMIMGVVDPDMITFGETFRIKPITVKNAKWFGLGGGAKQIETANVPAAIVAIKPEALQGRAAMVQQAAIKKIEETSETSLLPQQGWMQKLANTASLKTGAGLDSLMKSLEKSADGAKERLGKL
ncbi:hypothetical protein THII_3479 [Thioploca ingrica]|uniref:Uncharacterized protein n=1 Tax=Thioploca ingrica TaxID=40754 RepID=A0A090BW07_9GAMM|nr:hypothetical protein THII_3479 [Thioploca ingrica]